jgi:hypothetical protein
VLILLLCNISHIATGVPYPESPRNIFQSGPILIKIRCNLTCFRQVQSFDLLGWGSMSSGCFQKILKKVGVHVLRVVSKKYSNKWGSNPCPWGRILISLSSRTHLTPIPLSSHFRHVTQVRCCKISSINRRTGQCFHRSKSSQHQCGET